MGSPADQGRLDPEDGSGALSRGRLRDRFLKDEARRATKTASHNRLQEIRARKEDLAVAQTERERVPLVEAMILASSGESFADATALV